LGWTPINGFAIAGFVNRRIIDAADAAW